MNDSTMSELRRLADEVERNFDLGAMDIKELTSQCGLHFKEHSSIADSIILALRIHFKQVDNENLQQL